MVTRNGQHEENGKKILYENKKNIEKRVWTFGRSEQIEYVHNFINIAFQVQVISSNSEETLKEMKKNIWIFFQSEIIPSLFCIRWPFILQCACVWFLLYFGVIESLSDELDRNLNNFQPNLTRRAYFMGYDSCKLWVWKKRRRKTLKGLKIEQKAWCANRKCLNIENSLQEWKFSDCWRTMCIQWRTPFYFQWECPLMNILFHMNQSRVSKRNWIIWIAPNQCHTSCNNMK